MGFFAGIIGFFIILIAFAITMIANKNKSAEEEKNIFKAWKIIVIAFIGLVALLYTLSFLTRQMTVSEDDTYSEYIIDRDMFKGKQADWQYDHYRFEIKKDKTFLFHVTDKEKVLRTYTGYVTFHAPHVSSRIAIHMDLPTYHIIETNPTLYRDIWSFYYVFESKYYGNMFFKKGKWEPIED
jgi:amino acid transporter